MEMIKKSLIAVAIAGAFAAPLSAMADVTLSGAINMGPVFGSSGDGAPAGATNDVTGVNPAQPKGMSGSSLHSTYSHVDIESTDDIGNGNKVVFHYQIDLSGTSGALPQTTNIRNRNSFIGIVSDSWGSFKMGTNENVYERYMYEADPLDGAAGTGGNLNLLGTPGAGQVFETGVNSGLALSCAPTGAPGGGIAAAYTPTAGCVNFYRRTENTVWYTSPNLNGFGFEVDYTLPAYKTAAINPQILSVGGKYAPEGAPFSVDIAYERHTDLFGLQLIAGNVNTATSTGSSDTGIQIGGSYAFGGFDLRLRFERLTYELEGMAAGDVNEYERDAWWVAGKYDLPTGYVGAEYGQAMEADCTRVGAACDARGTGAKLLSAGYFHNLSKQSQLMAIVSLMRNDEFGTYVNIGSNTGIGQDGDSLYLGIKHVF